MDIKKMIVLVVTAFLLVGCGSASKLNKVEIGMTQQQVIDVIGEPNSTSAAEDLVYLRYNLWTEGFFWEDYFVQIKNDHVEAYGRIGDFGLGY